VSLVITVLLTLAAIWMVTSLTGVIVLIVLSLLVAVVLSDLVVWLERKGVGHGIAALISIVAVLLVFGFVLAITIPPLVRELDAFISNFPRIGESLRGRLAGNPALYDALERKIQELRNDPTGVLTGAFHFGWGVATNIFACILILTLTLYFLIDGAKTRASVLQHTPVRLRDRVRSARFLSQRNPEHRLAAGHRAAVADRAGRPRDHHGHHRGCFPPCLSTAGEQLHPAAHSERPPERVPNRDDDRCAGWW
jgi:predicted PurR-regulated permease PerM